MRPWLFALLVIVFVFAAFNALFAGQSDKSVVRRLAALPVDNGRVFLSWRYLPADGESCEYGIYRAENKSGPYRKAGSVGKGSGANFTDRGTREGRVYYYYITTPAGTSDTVSVTAVKEGPGFFVIPTNADSGFDRLTVGDLDGDGNYEFVIRHPGGYKDPYYRVQLDRRYKAAGTGEAPICLREDNPFKVEAYKKDGTMLWRYQLGAGVERGIWYAPMVVWDLDGDGCDEVIVRDVEGNAINTRPDDGREWLMALDPKTGKEKMRHVWPDWLAAAHIGNEFETYNYANRHLLGVAYLDGEKPSVIVQRGTYSYCRVTAFRGENLTLQWDTGWRTSEAFGQPKFGFEPVSRGAHGLGIADFNRDGSDEVLVGSTLLNGRGKVLWSVTSGHPDVVHVADIRPDLPGLETFFGIERYSYTEELPAVFLVDRDGNLLWSETGAEHVHGSGLAGLISKKHGWILAAREDKRPRAWVMTAAGEALARDDEAWDRTAGLALFWDGDLVREWVTRRGITDWDSGDLLAAYEGQPVMIADVIGDWREELITKVGSEIRIYTTSTPTGIRRPSLMDDRQYALGVARAAMGYYIQPHESPAWWGRE